MLHVNDTALFASLAVKLEPVYREPHLKLPPSHVFRGSRVRRIHLQHHFRPLSETFQEFLIHVLRLTFGPEWWNKQVATHPDDRHIVLRWAAELDRVLAAYSTGGPPGTILRAMSSGPMYALVVFAYDLFCLHSINRLPAGLVERLRHRGSFQGALYEVAVAAIMARAGFLPDFCEQDASGGKICEFIATDNYTRTKVAVEAKSRVRPGAVNERGEFQSKLDVEGMRKLFSRALKQGPAGLPFMIFLDVNMPIDPKGTVEQDFFNTFLGFMERVTEEHADRACAIALTNFAFHFGESLGEVHQHYSRMFGLRGHAPTLPVKILSRIERATRLYGNIPTSM